jgi:hypothetical protein
LAASVEIAVRTRAQHSGSQMIFGKTRRVLMGSLRAESDKLGEQ